MKNANLVSRPLWSIVVIVALGLTACSRDIGGKNLNVPMPPPATAADAPAVRYGYEVIKTWPHDRQAFTQGLVIHGDGFLESTGLNGHSTLRETELKTGRVLKQVALPMEFFGEGLAVVNGRAYQLTWQNHRGFVYDADTFRREREFSYAGEGWGLTSQGQELFLSDGSNRIRVLDPESFQVLRTIEVTLDGKPLDRLNELEWIKGDLFANVWQTDRVVRIDPANGRVRGVIDFSGLLGPADRGPETDVLNGIAYDPTNDRLFVTGKRWPKIFEVRLKAQP